MTRFSKEIDGGQEIYRKFKKQDAISRGNTTESYLAS